MENIRDYLKNNIVIFDGAMGSLLQKRGLLLGELPERWNITHKEELIDIHKSYIDAGADIITTNTFGLNGLKYDKKELKELAFAAIDNARKAGAKIVAFDIGPCGRMLKPWGDFPFEDAVALFANVCKLAEEGGADLILIETMSDSYETKAAVLAAKENTGLPVIASNAYGADGKLLTGADSAAMVAMLEGLGVDAVGANCSLGPKQLMDIARQLSENASVPVMLQPNAGLPVQRNGNFEYDISSLEFAEITASMLNSGVNIFGGCCGTNPEYIRLLKSELKKKCEDGSFFFKAKKTKDICVASSYAKAVYFDEPVAVGECINPSGKKLLKEAIRNNDIDYILSKAFEQEDAGADILDVNMGLPGTDEAENLSKAVFAIQSVCPLPLQIDSSDAAALERAMRLYNGKPVINSVNGKEESLNAVLPLVKKYGGVLVCLCLDENGIPDSVSGRIAIANRIAAKAAEYGIQKNNLIFDALTLPVSTNKDAAKITLDTVEELGRLGLKTILGVSNVSFGLPNREKLNAAFFTLALGRSLSAGIINPLSKEMMGSLNSFKALSGFDKDFCKYIQYMSGDTENQRAENQNKEKNNEEPGNESGLKHAIVKGLKDSAAVCSKELLKSFDALGIINNEIVPALDIVGKKYELGEIYLPQLLQSAEAAQAAFGKIKKMQKSGTAPKKAKFVLATVKGDIHDIGKNIVKLLLSNYGFDVIDLGKDVEPKAVLDAVKESGAKLCGLSALMTTTVPSMEKTVQLIKSEMPNCKIVVGGAVLTKEDADRMHADYYAKDAMATVRYAEKYGK